MTECYIRENMCGCPKLCRPHRFNCQEKYHITQHIVFQNDPLKESIYFYSKKFTTVGVSKKNNIFKIAYLLKHWSQFFKENSYS